MMRKSNPKKRPPRQPEDVTFDRSPARDKLNDDLDIAIANAEAHGLSLADVTERLLLRAEQTALLANERGQDLSHLAYLVGEVEP